MTQNTLSKCQPTKIYRHVPVPTEQSKYNRRLRRRHVHWLMKSILKRANYRYLTAYFYKQTMNFFHFSFLIIWVTWLGKKYDGHNSSSHITFIKTNIKEICETNIFLNEKNIFYYYFKSSLYIKADTYIHYKNFYSHSFILHIPSLLLLNNWQHIFSHIITFLFLTIFWKKKMIFSAFACPSVCSSVAVWYKRSKWKQRSKKLTWTQKL